MVAECPQHQHPCGGQHPSSCPLRAQRRGTGRECGKHEVEKQQLKGSAFRTMRWHACVPAHVLCLAVLLCVLQRKREDDVELYPPCHEFAGRILSALKHVTVITSTGLGKTVDMDLAHNIMKTAVNYRWVCVWWGGGPRPSAALPPFGTSPWLPVPSGSGNDCRSLLTARLCTMCVLWHGVCCVCCCAQA